MLVRQQLEEAVLSSSERTVADYLLDHADRISELSSIRLARKTYTSPATVVRLAQKLGFRGWTELKETLQKEEDYLNGAFSDIDANYPFQPEDTEKTIALKMARLYQESIQDSVHLIETERISRAVDLLEKSTRIVLFCVGDLNYLAQRFAHQLERIGKEAHISLIPGMHEHTAYQVRKGQCAILVSYSGETPNILESASILKENQIPFIAITSIGNNTLSSLADISLFISTREKVISKIYSFSSSLSITFLLDLLYSCLFARNYSRNDQYKKEIAVRIETKRNVKNSILLEKNQAR